MSLFSEDQVEAWARSIGTWIGPKYLSCLSEFFLRLYPYLEFDLVQNNSYMIMMSGFSLLPWVQIIAVKSIRFWTMLTRNPPPPAKKQKKFHPDRASFSHSCQYWPKLGHSDWNNRKEEERIKGRKESTCYLSRPETQISEFNFLKFFFSQMGIRSNSKLLQPKLFQSSNNWHLYQKFVTEHKFNNSISSINFNCLTITNKLKLKNSCEAFSDTSRLRHPHSILYIHAGLFSPH